MYVHLYMRGCLWKVTLCTQADTQADTYTHTYTTQRKRHIHKCKYVRGIEDENNGYSKKGKSDILFTLLAYLWMTNV